MHTLERKHLLLAFVDQDFPRIPISYITCEHSLERNHFHVKFVGENFEMGHI